MGMLKNRLILLFVFITISSFIFADSDPRIFGTAVTQGGEVRGNSTAVGTDSASGGNISNMNFTTEALTAKWQGYYGNVSLKNLRLGNSGTSNLYSWSTASQTNLLALAATTGANYDFANGKRTIQVVYIDAMFGFDGNDTDSVNNTMDDRHDADGNKDPCGHTLFNLVQCAPTANLTSKNGDGLVDTNSKFVVGNYYDTNPGAPTSQDDFAFVVNISSGPWRSYDNSTAVNYELIVPLNGTGDAVLGTTYYFYVMIR